MERYKRESLLLLLKLSYWLFKQIRITGKDLSSLLCFKVIFRHRRRRKKKKTPPPPKKQTLAAPAVDSIHRPPVLPLSVRINVCFFQGGEDIDALPLSKVVTGKKKKQNIK